MWEYEQQAAFLLTQLSANKLCSPKRKANRKRNPKQTTKKTKKPQSKANPRPSSRVRQAQVLPQLAEVLKNSQDKPNLEMLASKCQEISDCEGAVRWQEMAINQPSQRESTVCVPSSNSTDVPVQSAFQNVDKDLRPKLCVQQSDTPNASFAPLKSNIRKKKVSSRKSKAMLDSAENASNALAKSNRRPVTSEELLLLESVFVQEPYPNPQTRASLAGRLNKTPRQIQIWFQNKRARVKREGGLTKRPNYNYLKEIHLLLNNDYPLEKLVQMTQTVV